MSEVMTAEKLRERGFETEDGHLWLKNGIAFELKEGKLHQLTRTGDNSADEFVPGNELDRQATFVEMDKQDEEQIEMELRGQVLEQMVYRSRDGKTTALSWAGVKTVALKMAQNEQPISIESLTVERRENGFSAMAVARNLATGEQRWGVAEQPYKTEFRDKETKELHQADDQFAFQKVVSKAQRNAMRALLPEAEVATMIERWLKQKKGGNR